MILRCALATLCALTGAIRTVSGLQVPARPKQIRCQRAAAPAPAPQENEGDAAPAAAPLARSEDAPPPPSSNPFDALKKGFEVAVQSATNNPDYKFGDATRSVGRGAASAINAVTGETEYKFGDLSRWLDRSAKAKVNELTGEAEYKFGDLSRWLDRSAKDKVAELSSKDQYEFGDLTKLIVSRASQLTMKDATMLLKALLSFNVGLSSVGGLLPIKFLVEVLNYSLLVDVGERLAGMVAVEIDKRVKEALTGDSEYKLGDLTKRAVKTFTRKENYEFGDVSREVMRRFEEPGGDAATAFGDSDGSTAIDAELAEELDRWDARFLARDADTTTA
ncbi:unnamed protein product [Pelagomonas calceolata]|uniref:Uncharacterized protein n=1 Tax=Pelagomonas calceolata TaxID=35677 RepID=A0A7S4E729_9STRA|nr:unnamed protein product [Pelagomonas calceolata]|mmetsp:Transcript_11926/g.35613  ORF Transcript_11926/g.35613 Transcript_11926/m.35613 type:complete len:334 (+) Transcript_11926:135-1136(+)